MLGMQFKHLSLAVAQRNPVKGLTELHILNCFTIVDLAVDLLLFILFFYAMYQALLRSRTGNCNTALSSS